MSLRPDDSRSRGRSKSPSGRDRASSHSRAPSTSRAPSRGPSRGPSPAPVDRRARSPSNSEYGYRYGAGSVPQAPDAPASMPMPGDYIQEREEVRKVYEYDDRHRERERDRDRDYDRDRPRDYERDRSRERDYGRDYDRKSTYRYESDRKVYEYERNPPPQQAPLPYDRNPPTSPRPGYAQPSQYQYARRDELDDDHHARVRPEHLTRHLSLNVGGNAGFHVDASGHSPSQSYARPVSPQPQYSQPVSPQPQYARPLSSVGGYSKPPVSPKPQYAQPAAPQYAATPASPGYSHNLDYGYAQPPAHIAATQHDHQQRPPMHHSVSSPVPGYGQPAQYQYATAPSAEKITYVAKPQHPSEPAPLPYTQSAHPQVVEVLPGGHGQYQQTQMPLSPSGLSSHMHHLSVGGSASLTVGHGGGAQPPPSPLLEPYHGTYQSISPMPSPIMGPSTALVHGHHTPSPPPLDLAGLDYSSDDSSRPHHSNSKSGRRARIYDPDPDAEKLVAALSGHRTPDADALIDVLPTLTHDQMLALRTSYKAHLQIGGKGVNIAKHIKMRVTGAFGKLCYVLALGRWESEAHWANFWYQSSTSRRELLIEALLGRSNDEIRRIKDAFSDKRYGDDLEKCMKAELRADKFRSGILLVLEEKRQEESVAINTELVRRDVETLRRALQADKGGESVMIQVCVLRSETHLREVLRSYERLYARNFAKDMLRRSNNLVGESLAHILNGVINRPLRDALLLHHAIVTESGIAPPKDSETSVTLTVSKKGEELKVDKTERGENRTELLISRLVRYHWEKEYLRHVKDEYRVRYGVRVEEHLKAYTKGDFQEMLIEMCRV